jgi:hypothetical protein
VSRSRRPVACPATGVSVWFLSRRSRLKRGTSVRSDQGATCAHRNRRRTGTRGHQRPRRPRPIRRTLGARRRRTARPRPACCRRDRRGACRTSSRWARRCRVPHERERVRPPTRSPVADCSRRRRDWLRARAGVPALRFGRNGDRSAPAARHARGTGSVHCPGGHVRRGRHHRVHGKLRHQGRSEPRYDGARRPRRRQFGGVGSAADRGRQTACDRGPGSRGGGGRDRRARFRQDR